MRYFPFTFLLFLFFISAAYACRDLRLSYEPCTSTEQCLALDESESPYCAGRDKNGTLLECGTPGAENCICRPLQTHYCTSNEGCLDGEYCGTSRRSGNNLCVGCLTRHDEFYKTYFTPVEKAATSLRCEKKRHEKCGTGGDYCSVTMPCAKGYTCINNYDDSLFLCSWESRRCRCAIQSTDEVLSATAPNNLEYRTCREDHDCFKREVCARYTTRNENVCISCDLARHAYDIRPLFGLDKCKSARHRKQPESYVEGPNGKTMDRCRTDEHCLDNRKCVRRSRNGNDGLAPCDNVAGILCFCRPDVFKKCSDGKDCEDGESCITEPLFKLKSNCASNAFLDVVSAKQYEVIGTRSYPPKGTLVNNDKCEFDWQCAGMRRCTHIADLYGRCAGRRQCSCQPLIRKRCESDAKCDEGETCATTQGTRSHPSCVSTNVVKSNPYYFKVDQLPKPTKKPLPEGTKGLTGQPCNTVNDCNGERSCVHIFDLKDDSGCRGGRVNCICKNVSVEARKIARCETTKDCTPGEACVVYIDEVPKSKRCIARSSIQEMEIAGLGQFRVCEE